MYYENGKIDGVSKKYYENGSLQSITEYKDGEEITPTKWYDENGNSKPSL